MPSPIAHAAVGYAIYRTYKRKKAQTKTGPFPPLLLAALIFSQLPDLDFLLGFFFHGAFDQFHNTITNSLFVGVFVALIVGGVAWLWQRSGFWFWFGFSLICYELHVLMDLFTVGRGVMLFWPLTVERFAPPFKLFYGLHRSDGWVSIRHLWTFISEGVFTSLIAIIIHRLMSEKEPETG